MTKALAGFVLIAAITSGIFTQGESADWKEWTKKQADKVLNDSPWIQTQTERIGGETEEPTRALGDTRGRENSITSVTTPSMLKFHVRFFSARPIRQAYVRIVRLSDKPPDETVLQKMDTWANVQADDQIIVAVAFESSDQRTARMLAKVFAGASTDVLKENVFFERKDGKRLYLTEYVPPAKDPFGARFIFPRTVDGESFMKPDGGAIRFHAEYEMKPSEAQSRGKSADKFKIDVKFKPAEMIYDGAFEF